MKHYGRKKEEENRRGKRREKMQKKRKFSANAERAQAIKYIHHKILYKTLKIVIWWRCSVKPKRKCLRHEKMCFIAVFTNLEETSGREKKTLYFWDNTMHVILLTILRPKTTLQDHTTLPPQSHNPITYPHSNPNKLHTADSH